MNPSPRLIKVDRPDADRSAISCELSFQWLVDLWVQKHPLAPRLRIGQIAQIGVKLVEVHRAEFLAFEMRLCRLRRVLAVDDDLSTFGRTISVLREPIRYDGPWPWWPTCSPFIYWTQEPRPAS